MASDIKTTMFHEYLLAFNTSNFTRCSASFTIILFIINVTFSKHSILIQADVSRKARNIFSELSLVITAFLASCIFLQFDATILDSLESSSAGSLLHSILDVLRFLPNTNWSMKNSFTFDKEFLPLITHCNAIWILQPFSSHVFKASLPILHYLSRHLPAES